MAVQVTLFVNRKLNLQPLLDTFGGRALARAGAEAGFQGISTCTERPCYLANDSMVEVPLTFMTIDWEPGIAPPDVFIVPSSS